MVFRPPRSLNEVNSVGNSNLERTYSDSFFYFLCRVSVFQASGPGPGTGPGTPLGFDLDLIGSYNIHRCAMCMCKVQSVCATMSQFAV